jgi:hypothetical protein
MGTDTYIVPRYHPNYAKTWSWVFDDTANLVNKRDIMAWAHVNKAFNGTMAHAYNDKQSHRISSVFMNLIVAAHKDFVNAKCHIPIKE